MEQVLAHSGRGLLHKQGVNPDSHRDQAAPRRRYTFSSFSAAPRHVYWAARARPHRRKSARKDSSVSACSRAAASSSALSGATSIAAPSATSGRHEVLEETTGAPQAMA